MEADELRLGKELGELELGHVARPVLANLTHQLEQGGHLKSSRFFKLFSTMIAKFIFVNYFDHSMLEVYIFGSP